MTKVRVRVADWRDWKEIQALRALLARPFDGGLYELLHWPVYHVHYAMPLDSKEVIGFTSVVLMEQGAAEDYGTVVAPDWRRQGVASQLRLTQVRDLIEMGWSTLFSLAPSPEAEAWAGTHLAPVEAIEGSTYFAETCTTMLARLLDRGILIPHQLSPDNKARLGYKAGRALQDLARLSAYAEQAVHRAVTRSHYLTKDV